MLCLEASTMPAHVADAHFVIHAVRLTDSVTVLDAEAVDRSACCPTCGTRSDIIHGCYVRRPMDLPWRGQLVRMRLTVRRFQCRVPDCPRQTFAEDFGAALPRYAHRTAAVTAFILRLAVMLGGEAGARLAREYGVQVSADTLLRVLRGAPPPSFPVPRVLGVDDWSMRRGHRYGTILVDLETHRPVDLLHDREAKTLAGWLEAHPGVEIVARDRAGAYAEGVRSGAPDARQVADRFHLVQNAGAALDDLLRGRRRALETVTTAAQPPQPTGGSVRPPSPTMLRFQARRDARRTRFERARALHAEGHAKRQIAREVGVCVRTVRRWIAAPAPPQGHVTPLPRERPGHLDSPSLQPYLSFLQDRWQGGCENASQLYRELVTQGYEGSYSRVRSALHPWRGSRLARKRRKRMVGLRWLCLRPREQLSQEEDAALEELLGQDELVAQGYELLNRFRAIVRDRDPQALAAWLPDALASSVHGFAALGKGIMLDRDAVDAALTLPWSTGPVEGHIHRLKLIKRQGYGRAKLDLLKARALAA
jgi:transposase